MKIKAALPLIIGAIFSVLISILTNVAVTQIPGKTTIIYILLILSIVLLLITELSSKLNREKKIKEKEQESAAVLQPSSSRRESIDTLKVDDEIKFEAENVAKEVEAAQKTIDHQENLHLPEEVSRSIDEVLKTANVSPRAALLLLSAKIEGQMRKRLEGKDMDFARPILLSSEVIDKAIKEGILPLQIASSFRDFRTIRNRIAHDQAEGVSDDTILSLVSTGIDLLKILAARKEEDQEVYRWRF